MKNRGSKKDEGSHEEKLKSSKSIRMKMKEKKNRSRLGGGSGGLSLEAFANAKSNTGHYNPALIKQQKEFYKNAKCVSKFKRMLKQQGQQSDPSPAVKTMEDENENGCQERSNPVKRNKKRGSYSLKDVYEKRREEEEKARMEREAIIQAKKEEKEKALTRRKAEREKMFKRTRHGQPVMKYRIEHLLQAVEDSRN